MFKIIHVVGEEFGLRVDRNEDSEAVVLCLNDYILDEKKSEPGNPVYRENRKLEVYPTVDEVNEIIKALQQILPEEETHE